VTNLVAARPNRDRATWAGYILITSYVWFVYAFSSSQALIRDEQGTSRTIASLHVILLSLGGIIAGLVAARLILRLGRDRFITFSVAGLAAGVLLYTAPGGTPVTLTGTFMASFFGSSIIVGASAFLFDHQKAAGPASITEANALAALSGALAPIAVGVGVAIIFGWRIGLWITLLGLLVSLLLMRKNLPAFRVPIDEQVREEHRIPFPRRFWWALITLFVLLTSEFILTLWSVDLLRDRGGLEAGAAAATVGALTLGIFIGRVIGSRFAEYFPVDRILSIAVLIAFSGWLIVWLSTSAPIMIGGLVISGIGVALFWPMGVSRVVMASGGQNDRATALGAVAGASAGGVGPFALGALADAIGVHSAFLVLPVVLFFGLFLILIKPVNKIITPETTPISTT
jgi:predicted MFS family arabinose efflux permease